MRGAKSKFAAAACTSAILVLSSIGQVQKFLGFAGVALYVPAVIAIVAIIAPRALRFLRARSERQIQWLTALTFAGLLAAFAVGYPIANSGVVGGGSDREDNLNVATEALLRGGNPYHVRGYLDFPVDVLPGAILLAVPFVLLGNSAYQNLFWLAVLFGASRRFLRDRRAALLLLWLLLSLAPAVLQELVTGGDLIANSVYVVVLALWMVETAARADAPLWQKIASSALFGLALSSRANFAFVGPVVLSLLVHRAGWRNAIRFMAVAALTFLAVSLPLYLADPDGFAPARLQNRFGWFRRVLPYAEIVVPALTAAIALALSHRRFTRSSTDLLRNSAIILGFPVVCGIALLTIASPARGLMFAVQGWGLFFLFCGALHFWGRFVSDDEGEPAGS